MWKGCRLDLEAAKKPRGATALRAQKSLSEVGCLRRCSKCASADSASRSLVKKMTGKESSPEQDTAGSGSGGLGYIGRLRPFLSLDDFKLNLIALLQAFVAFGGNGAVVNEHIRSIVAAEKTISLRVVEPLDRTFQTFHVHLPLLLTDPPEKAEITGVS